MSAYRRVLAALLMTAFPAASQGQSAGYWLIGQVGGKWEYRIGQEAGREITGEYDYLVPSGEVRCLEDDLRRCELRYLADPRSGATRKLPVQPRQNGRWISLRNLTPPPPPVLPITADALAAKFKRVTQAGGSRTASACGGDFPLRAPVCGENIDVSDFNIHWLPAAEPAAARLAILVEPVDGRSDVFRATSPASAGSYGDARLTDFLRRIQQPNEPVDITVTVLADGGRTARRLVHLPPSTSTNEYESRVRAATGPDPVLNAIATMSLALDESMWSRAGEAGLRLIDFSVGWRRLQEYALAGTCQSDFEEQRARLRKSLSAATYARICPVSPVSSSAVSGPVEPAPAAIEPAVAADPANAAVPPKIRSGIALLIGNSDYWNLPLNSVKQDLENMEEALKAAGFEVSVQRNLKGPRQFVEALNGMLQEKGATSDDVLIVYYSGHGLQLDGKAQLLGTGISTAPQVAEDVRANAQSAEGLLAQMERAIPETRILIMEACRDSFFSTQGAADGQAQRAGFAFQQDDVPNTFVMFANRPGLPAPARSDYSLMGPFTEALIYALRNSSGEILDVFEVAAQKTKEMSPQQEPVLHQSRLISPVVLKPRGQELQDVRAKNLLNDAEPLYRKRAWDRFLVNVVRGKVLASSQELQQRLSREVEFATLVKEAASLEEAGTWGDAAARWQKAAGLFPAREWVAMKSAVAWLLVDDLTRAVQSLAVLAAQSESATASRAKSLLADLLKAFPALEAEATTAAQRAGKITGDEFEVIKHEE